MKVGKEEIMGMLAAVEMWPKRDHKAEWQMWEDRLAHISKRLGALPAVSCSIRQPSADLSNRTPALRVEWDQSRLPITGAALAKQMLDTEPRVVVANPAANSINIIPYMLMPGEEKIIADKLHAILTAPQSLSDAQPLRQPATNVAGQWELHLDFGRGSAVHTLVFEQDGNKLFGTHRGEFDQGNLSGTISDNQLKFRSSLPTIGSRLGFDFTATLEGDRLKGTVNLGEYGQASFSGVRHKYV